MQQLLLDDSPHNDILSLYSSLKTQFEINSIYQERRMLLTSRFIYLYPSLFIDPSKYLNLVQPSQPWSWHYILTDTAVAPNFPLKSQQRMLNMYFKKSIFQYDLCFEFHNQICSVFMPSFHRSQLWPDLEWVMVRLGFTSCLKYILSVL